MKINLAKEEKTQLELRHQVERDGRIRDRIKSVLLRDEGWSISKIAQALRISSDTVGRYVVSGSFYPSGGCLRSGIKFLGANRVLSIL